MGTVLCYITMVWARISYDLYLQHLELDGVGGLFPNGTSPHTWGTNLCTITLHIPYKYSLSCTGDMGTCGIHKELTFSTMKENVHAILVDWDNLPTKYWPLGEDTDGKSPLLSPAFAPWHGRSDKCTSTTFLVCLSCISANIIQGMLESPSRSF